MYQIVYFWGSARVKFCWICFISSKHSPQRSVTYWTVLPKVASSFSNVRNIASLLYFVVLLACVIMTCELTYVVVITPCAIRRASAVVGRGDADDFTISAILGRSDCKATSLKLYSDAMTS